MDSNIMSAKVGSTTGRTLKELPVWRSDVWLRDVCLVCQMKYCTAEQKAEHASSETHLKRVTLYDFFSKESRSLKSASRPSVLLNRYKQSHALAIGLECIHEFIMPFCSTPWWACSICYKADASLDTLDDHLHSIPHIKTYIDEFHPSRVIDENLDRFTLIEKLYAMRLELLKEQGRLESPEVLNVEGATKEWAVQKLAIVENVNHLPFKIGELFGGHEALHCKICHSTIASVEQMRERCWETHVTSSYHQRMQLLASVISQFDSHKTDNPFDGEPKINKWRQTANGTFIGPIAGLQYLFYFGTHPYCDLCYTVLDEDDAMEHFCSENHLIKFLSYHRPGAMYTTMYLPDEARRTQMLSLFESIGNDNRGGFPRQIEAPYVPEVISANSNPNVLNAPSLMAQWLPVGSDESCFWCPVCWRVLKVSGKEAERISVWTEHCTKSKKHFQAAVRRALFNFEDENFVDMVSTLQLPKIREEAIWKRVKLDGNEVEVQHQTEVGLDFLVDDCHNQEVICVACAAIFPRSNVSDISLHVRSMDHLIQFLHATDREMYYLVRSQKSSQVEHDLLMDYLRRSISSPGTIRVYNADLAATIAGWGCVPYRKVELSGVEAELRPICAVLSEIIDRVADDGVELITVPVKDALQLCSVRIHSINGKTILLYCTGCERVFSVVEGAVVEGTWDGHLLGTSHARRVASLAKNKLDANGFIDEKPKFTATVVDQQDVKKRVVWRWKESANLFEYVYAVVGIGDMVERRSIGTDATHTPDIYCTLCAEVVPCSQEWLDSHLRSLPHVFNYVQKYCANEIARLEELQRESSEDGGKSLRKHLGLVLKDVSSNTIAEMRVYDPYGVQKQREAEAFKVAAMEAEKDRRKEKIKKLAEQRKKRFEQQKHRDAKLEEERHQRAANERREELARMLAKRRYEREREKRMKRREAEHRKAREEEAKKRQQTLAMVRERKKEEDAKKKQEEVQREERIAQLRREEQALAEAQKAEIERQHAMQIQMEERRIEQEMLLIRQEKARIMQNLSTIQNRQERAVDLSRLTVTVPNLDAPSRLMVTVPNPASLSPTVGSIGNTDRLDSWSSVSSVRHPSDLPKPEPLMRKYASTHRSSSVTATRSHSLAASRVLSPAIDSHQERRDHAKKMEVHLKAFKHMESRELLVDYLWKQGGEAIPEAEMPQKFNGIAAQKRGLLGLSSVYQVQCSDRRAFESFYCSACSVWTTASDMFNHLMTPEHRLGYLFRNYKMYHKSAMSQPNVTVRDQMLEQFAQQIWKLEGSGEVKYRLSCAVNYETILRLWPQHIRLLNDDWMDTSDKRVSSTTPPPGIESSKEKQRSRRCETLNKEERERTRSGRQSNENVKSRNKAKEQERINQRERDTSSKDTERSPPQRKEASYTNNERNQCSTSRRRSRSNSRSRSHYRARIRSPATIHSRRSRSRSKLRDRYRSPPRIARFLNSLQNMQDESAWEDAAAAFLTKIGDKRAAERMRGRSPSRSRSRSRTVSRRRRSRSRTSSSRRRNRSRSRCTHSRSHASESNTRKGQHEYENCEKKKSAFDERIEQESTGGLLKVWEGLPEEVDKHLKKVETVKRLPSDEDIDRILANRAKVIEQGKPRDPKENMRKLLGLLVTMQQEIQQRGNLDDATVSRLYKEVGVTGGDLTSSATLLQQLCHMLADDAAASSSSTTEPYHHPDQLSKIDLERYGIAPAKESSPASFVYPGAPTPTEVTPAATRDANLSYAGGYDGVDRTAMAKDANKQSSVPMNPWINGSPGGGPPPSLLTSGAQPSNTDIYAARRMKEITSAKGSSAEQGISSYWVGQPLSRIQDETGALSRSAGFPVQHSTVPAIAVKMCNEMDEDEINAFEGVTSFDDDMNKLGKKSVVDPRQKLLEIRPDLSRWTGANNPANNTTLKAVIDGTGPTTPSKQPKPQTQIDPWNRTGVSQQSTGMINSLGANKMDQMKVAGVEGGEDGIKEVPGSGQKRQSCKERRGKRQVELLAAKTVMLSEAVKAAVEPINEPDHDLEGSNDVLWVGNTESSYRHTDDANYSSMRESFDRYSTTRAPIDSNADHSAHRFGAFTVQPGTSSTGKNVYAASHASNTSFSSNKSVPASLRSTATWEDLRSTVSALFSNAKKQNATQSSLAGSPKKKTTMPVLSSEEPPPPPPPPPPSSSSKSTGTAPTQYDSVSSTVVTQYSGQPTKYSQPTTTRVYNPTLPNYGLSNPAEPLYTSTIGAENVFAATTIKQTMYGTAQQSLYGGMQQSGYMLTPVTQPPQTTSYYNSYYSSFPMYNQF